VGASPYILNCANRSQWGRGGVLWDGVKLGGLKSFVTAQFTNTSEQNDVNSWEVYNGSNWVTPADYDALIAADPNDTRAKFARSSRHITCINDGFGARSCRDISPMTSIAANALSFLRARIISRTPLESPFAVSTTKTSTPASLSAPARSSASPKKPIAAPTRKTAFAVFGGVGILFALIEVFDGDEPCEASLLIHQGKLFDFVLGKNCQGIFSGHSF